MAKLSRPDVLVAYMILQHDTILSEIDPDRPPIDTVVSVIDYRGNPGLAPVAIVWKRRHTLYIARIRVTFVGSQGRSQE